MRTAVLTVSTSVSRREAEDESGPALAALAEDAGCEVVAMEVVPDDFALIEDRLHHFVDDGCDLIFTTGGTGLTPDDVTPEATRAVIDARGARLRRGDARGGASRSHAARDPLARDLRASPGMTLIVNFPGSPKAVDERFPVLAPDAGPRRAHPAGRLPAWRAAIELDGRRPRLRRARRRWPASR